MVPSFWAWRPLCEQGIGTEQVTEAREQGFSQSLTRDSLTDIAIVDAIDFPFFYVYVKKTHFVWTLHLQALIQNFEGYLKEVFV